MEQQARWRLVNVLGDADNLCASLADRHDDLHIVGSAAGQPINLMDDHEVDIPPLQPVEHGPERRALGGRTGLATVDVLVSDNGTELCRLPLAGISLSGDGEALDVEIVIGLLGAGYPQIDEGSLSW
ncbi:MAG TPA: hypothetical protein VII45_00840 [Solirubrobacterales bacterium]